MTIALTLAPTTHFHLSLNVTVLDRAVDFYRTLFGLEPAKHHADYAKFELVDPPVVFSLVPRPPALGGTLCRMGLRLGDPSSLEAMQQRLQAAGHAARLHHGPDNSDSTTHLETYDPDGTPWLFYLHEDDRAALERTPPTPTTLAVSEASGPAIWEHCVTHPVPARVAHDDHTADEVRLVGSLNADLDNEARTRLFQEARRILKPGGKIFVHGLMADAPLTGPAPTLPGAAAMVQRIPALAEPLDALHAQGFVGIEIVKCSERPWFTHEGVGLREVQVIGWKPGHDASKGRAVLYRGPFAQAEDDAGQSLARGQRTPVAQATFERLQHGSAADQFLFIDRDAAASSCG